MHTALNAFAPRQVKLLPSLFLDRFNLNRGYVLRLKTEALLQNHFLEAGLSNRRLRSTTHGRAPDAGDDMHWGWESPTWKALLPRWLPAYFPNRFAGITAR